MNPGHLLKSKSGLLVLIILAGLGLRLYQIGTPLADWHSFRQADTASVAREYLKHGLDLLRPRYHDLSDIQSGKDNPQGYRMVEFPLISGLVALTFPEIIPLHVYYRLVDIAFSLGSLICLYLLVSRLFKPSVGLISAVIFAVLPYNVYYSRTILPEIPMVFFALLSLWLFVLYVDRYPGWLLLLGSSVAAAVSLLLKPVALLFFPPLVVYLLVKKGWRSLFDLKLWPALIIAVVPLWLWRHWILNFPQGIPVSDWLFNGNGIRLRPAWFRWLFYERLTKLILGFAGLIPFGVGVYSTFRSRRFTPGVWFTLIWGISGLAYLIVLATGNVQHDYYQIPLIPWVCLVTALGLNFIWQQNRLFTRSLLIIVCGLALFLSWNQISGYYHINNWAIVKAGQAVDQLTPPDALVIAPYTGDTAFLYQTNRRGWPIGFYIPEKIKMGAQYYVSVSYDDEARVLEKLYPTVSKTPDYILLKLQ